MPAYTTVLGLYKPGGGSTGQDGPDEVVDVDKLNANFDRIDSAVGFGIWSTATRPISPFMGQTGLNVTLDCYERWTGAVWANVSPSYLTPNSLANTYFTQGQLTGGKLDSRYFTQANLLNDGKLDSRYYTKSAIKFDHGVYTATTTTDPTRGFSDNNTTINFGTAFTQPPQVVMTPQSAATAEQHWGANSITKSSFQPYYWRSDTVDATIEWIAIGV